MKPAMALPISSARKDRYIDSEDNQSVKAASLIREQKSDISEKKPANGNGKRGPSKIIPLDDNDFSSF